MENTFDTVWDKSHNAASCGRLESVRMLIEHDAVTQISAENTILTMNLNSMIRKSGEPVGCITNNNNKTTSHRFTYISLFY